MTRAAEEVIWHEAECGAYSQDLSLWEDMAAKADGPVLDLGCGTGRVALYLARRGHDVVGVDRAESLIGELKSRAAAEHLELGAIRADVRELELNAGSPRVSLAIAPMQLYQLLGGPDERITALRAIHAALAPGGSAALAVVEGTSEPLGEARTDVLPDVREVDRWIYSSLPIEIAERDGHFEIHRLRQTVSPEGQLTEEIHVDRLRILDRGTVESEAPHAGLTPAGRREIPPSDLHVGSTVVLLRKEP